MIYQETEEYEKGFAQYFQEHITDDLKKIENDRLEYLNKFNKIGKFLIPAAVFSILFILSSSIFIINKFIFSALIGGITFLVLYCPTYSYKYSAKKELMPKIVKFFGNFTYSPKGKITRGKILASKLIPDFNSQVSNSEDKIAGTYKKVSIEIAEVHLAKTVNPSQNSQKEEIFKGIIIFLSMNKNFEGQTIVIKKNANLSNKQFSSFQRVNLEDPYFEKLFEVYSSDQIEARYLLTTAFMEKLIKLSETFENIPIQCSFFNNSLMITIPVKKNLFEPASIFKSSYDIQGIKTVLKEIYYTLSIIDILKLNEKIGL